MNAKLNTQIKGGHSEKEIKNNKYGSILYSVGNSNVVCVYSNNRYKSNQNDNSILVTTWMVIRILQTSYYETQIRKKEIKMNQKFGDLFQKFLIIFFVWTCIAFLFNIGY